MDDLKTYVETLLHDEMKSYENLACCAWDCAYDEKFSLFKLVRKWGGEGQGDSQGVVISVDMNGVERFLCISWAYDSWEGSYFNTANYNEVFPKEKTVTVFEDSYHKELFTGIPT